MRKAGGLAGVLVTRLCLVGLAVHRTSAWYVAPPIAAKGAARYMFASAHRPRIASAQGASRPMMMVRVAGDGAVSADTTKREEAGERELMSAAELALRDLPKAEMECWRPTTDDVDRISWGKPAKKKSTGSRGVPHRLNEDERILYDMARRKGFVEIGGSGWRKQRRGAPLVNTYRNWCDARAVPAIYLFKNKDGIDEVVLDLSPLRVPELFLEVATQCAGVAPGGMVEALDGGDGEIEMDAAGEDVEERTSLSSEAAGRETALTTELKEAFLAQPIHRLPMYSVCWELERSAAKAVAKDIAQAFECMETGAKAGGASLVRGMPKVKAGKSRQHGGYGIGSKNNKNGGRKGKGKDTW